MAKDIPLDITLYPPHGNSPGHSPRLPSEKSEPYKIVPPAADPASESKSRLDPKR